MEVIDAFWEKENLGRTAFEILVSNNDSFENFAEIEKSLIRDKAAQYLVVKVAANQQQFLFNLEKLGYHFVECAFTLALRKRNYVCPKHVARFDSDVTVKELHGEVLGKVFAEIDRGMFQTDRISVDPNFSQKLAANRYNNWIKNTLLGNGRCFEVYLKGAPLGFFILKELNSKKAQGILTGLYESYATSGFGTLIMKKLKDTVWELGYQHYVAQVVSNNMNALRSNLIFGSEIESLTHNYVKHI